MPIRLAAAAIAILLSASLSGCFMWNYGRFDPMARGDQFDESRKHFTRMIRWGQLERAYQAKLEDLRASSEGLHRAWLRHESGTEEQWQPERSE